MNLDGLMQPEWHHILIAGSVIHRRVRIRAEPSSLIANYSKTKRVELLRSCIVIAVEGNWKLEAREDIEEVEEKTREAEERDSRKAR